MGYGECEWQQLVGGLANGTPSIFGAAASVAGIESVVCDGCRLEWRRKMDLAVVNNGMTASTYMVSILLWRWEALQTPVNIDIETRPHRAAQWRRI